MPALTIADLTSTTVEGAGAFDVLMRAVRSQLDKEFLNGRIKGPEYSTVYLGSVNLAMQTGLAFLLQKDKQDLETQLLQKQIELATVQVAKAEAELAILEATQLKIPAEIAQLEAQTLLIGQQRTNLVAEALNIPKQGVVLDSQAAKIVAETEQTEAQTLLVEQNTANAVIEGANLTKQGEVLVVQKAHITQQTENLAAEELNIPKQGAVLDAQKDHVLQQTTNLEAEALNIPKQGKVLDAQECKLKAEYDLLVKQIVKADSEIGLLTQKTATEKAQTQALGVDADSVVGRQKGLYVAQTNGFIRDAEQKAAKLLVDTWSVRRTTDEGVAANTTNKLDDTAVGRAVDKLLTGVGA